MNTDYEEVFLPKSKKRVKIPVDENGYVPERALINRVSNNSGSNDFDEQHSILIPNGKLTPRMVAAWWEDPGCCDIEEIDVRGKPRTDIGQRTGKDAEFQKKIVVYGTAEEEKRIRKLLDESFPDEKDRKALVGKGKITVTARPLSSDRIGETDAVGSISLDRQRGMTTSTTVHEGSHMLRAKDETRKDPKTKSAVQRKGWSASTRSNVEESLTVAEQLARREGTSGYYHFVPVKDKETGRWRSPTDSEARTMCEQDRILFSGGKQLDGDKAVESVSRNWSKSHIARLRINGKGKMAVNAVSEYDNGVTPVKVRVSKKKEAPKTEKCIPIPKKSGRKTSGKKTEKCIPEIPAKKSSGKKSRFKIRK